MTEQTEQTEQTDPTELSDRLADAAARIFAAKLERRRELARLPIEEKLRLVALLQRQENEVRRAAGRPQKPEWPLPPEPQPGGGPAEGTCGR